MSCSDLGVHIDGFIAVQATTLVIGFSDDTPVTGRAADVVACAQTCFDAAMRLIRPGNRVTDVSGPLNAIAESFECTLVEGVMTHNMKQFVIDGNKCVLNRPSADQKVDDNLFEENEVYAIDVVVSTGKPLGNLFYWRRNVTCSLARRAGDVYRRRKGKGSKRKRNCGF